MMILNHLHLRLDLDLMHHQRKDPFIRDMVHKDQVYLLFNLSFQIKIFCKLGLQYHMGFSPTQLLKLAIGHA
jgi:hypothetical protein